MSRSTWHTAWVDGIAVWGSRLPGWEIARAMLRGEQDAPTAPAPRPSPALLPANERRRAPDTVAIALEAAHHACVDAGRDPRTLPSVFASTYGDLAVTDYMCETLAASPDALSPTRFHNSVHNAAAGYWSIATGSMAPYTAISARFRTFSAGLVEALAQAACDRRPVLYVAYDIQARGPLASMAPSEGLLAAALVLAPEPSRASKAKLDWQLHPDPSPADATPSAAHASLAAGNAMAGCIPLLAALARDQASALPFSAGPGLSLDLRIEPGCKQR